MWTQYNINNCIHTWPSNSSVEGANAICSHYEDTTLEHITFQQVSSNVICDWNENGFLSKLNRLTTSSVRYLATSKLVELGKHGSREHPTLHRERPVGLLSALTQHCSDSITVKSTLLCGSILCRECFTNAKLILLPSISHISIQHVINLNWLYAPKAC